MNQRMTIQDLQAEMESALMHLSKFAPELPAALKPLVRLAPRPGSRASVSLRHAKTDRQVKRNAPADSWSADSGVIAISFGSERINEPAIEIPPATQHVAASKSTAEDAIRELVIGLAKAERIPQLSFVSLKWFRDTYLVQQGFSWAGSVGDRQQAVAEAINRRWILNSKVPNPKNPQFPVTSIRVNRSQAEVREMLDRDAGFGSTFAPITISGENLSDTVLRGRR